jgi:hypothetical protein
MVGAEDQRGWPMIEIYLTRVVISNLGEPIVKVDRFGRSAGLVMSNLERGILPDYFRIMLWCF